MARATHGHSATPDAQRRARLELRSPARIRERHLAKIVGIRRTVHAGGGCRRRLRRRAQHVGDHGGDRQSRHEIADRAVRCTDAALSPAGYHAHLRARKAERDRRSEARLRSGMPNIFATCSSAPKPRPPLHCRTGLASTARSWTICAPRWIGPSRRMAIAQLGIALTAVAVTLWVRLSLFAECRERARTALGGARRPRRRRGVRMQLLAALGWSLMYGEGRAREARPILEATLELADRLDDKDFRLRALWGLCIDQFNNGAVRQGARARRSFRECGGEFIRQDRSHAGGPADRPSRCIISATRRRRGSASTG